MTLRRSLALVLALFVLQVGTAAAQTTHAPVTRLEGDGVGGSLGPYRIGPEDILAIVVWRNDAISRTVPVRPDGMITLPLLNDIKAAGLTPMELRDVITEKLLDFMQAPEVSVIVSGIHSFRVSVMGEVPRPSRYELRSWTTILDVLAQAGGFTQFANRSRILILRPNGGNMQRIPFNYNRAVGGAEEENHYLRPGDIILVP